MRAPAVGSLGINPCSCPLFFGTFPVCSSAAGAGAIMPVCAPCCAVPPVPPFLPGDGFQQRDAS